MDGLPRWYAPTVVVGVLVCAAIGATLGAATADTDDPADASSTTVPIDEGTARLSPSEVRVVVLNDSGVSGACARHSNVLLTEGYDVLPCGNATEPGDASSTRVLYVPGYEAEAAELADRLSAPANGVRVLTPPHPGDVSGADLVVVLGFDLAIGDSSTDRDDEDERDAAGIDATVLRTSLRGFIDDLGSLDYSAAYDWYGASLRTQTPYREFVDFWEGAGLVAAEVVSIDRVNPAARTVEAVVDYVLADYTSRERIVVTFSRASSGTDTGLVISSYRVVSTTRR